MEGVFITQYQIRTSVSDFWTFFFKLFHVDTQIGHPCDVSLASMRGWIFFHHLLSRRRSPHPLDVPQEAGLAQPRFSGTDEGVSRLKS